MKKDIKKKKKQPGTLEEKAKSFGSLLMTLVVVLFIQSFFIQGYSTPTGSMLNTILIGDKMFFNQFLYGGSTPRNIPFTEIRLPYWRLPAIREPRRNEVVNFEYPGDRDEIEATMKVQYLKRLVGQPGDVVEIKNKILFVNGEKFPEPPTMQYQYKVRLDSSKMTKEQYLFKLQNPEYQAQFEITDTKGLGLINESRTSYFFVVPLPNNKVEEFKKQPFIKSVEFAIDGDAGEVNRTFPKGMGWTKDNYGPLRIPVKGDEITLTAENYHHWETFIRREGRKVEMRGGQIYIDGQANNKYTVGENYYFAMGDNRDNSLDSRFFGFVPQESIVGKAWFVYFYWDSQIPFSEFGKLIGSVKLDRVGKPIE